MILPRKSAFFLVVAILLLSCNACFRQPARSEQSGPVIVYPDPPAQPRIQYLTSFSSSKDFNSPQSAFNKFIFGEETALPIIKPYGITIHSNKIYICDTGLGGLEILDMENKTFEYFIPRGLGKLKFPINCALDERGYIYVADGNRKQVVIFSDSKTFENAISLYQDCKPTDLAVDGSTIYISVVDDHSIHMYDKYTGEFTGKFPGIEGQGKGYLYQPANIEVHDSIIYVSDIGACSIHTFDKKQQYLSSFGKPGRGFGQFTRPKGVDADKYGNIYVVDAAFENVQVFDPSGKLLISFGGTYEGPGGMWLPAGIAIDDQHNAFFREYVDNRFVLDYLIFVTNQYGPDKISVYGFLNQEKQ
jgi:DNA-binding beta-propeller fold protein YncE